MMNNYLMNNNLTRDERLFLDGDEERMGRGGMTGNLVEDSIIPQMFSKIKEDLDQISISEQVRKIKGQSLDEIRKITNNSKYFSQVEDIFNRDTEHLEEHFHMIQATISNKKMSILKTLSYGIEKIQEDKLNQPQGMFDPNSQNVNLLNHVYDDEFVTLINSLSSAIKEFFKKSRSSFTTMKGISEHMIEHLFNSKTSISEALAHVNSMMITVTNAPKQKDLKGTSAGKEKLVKEKITLLMDKLENLNETRVNFLKNLKSLEQNSAKFYEEAKVLFKRMKEARTDKLEEYNLVSNSGGINNYNQTMNCNNMGNTTQNYNMRDSDTGYNNIKNKSLADLHQNQQSRMQSTSPTARNKINNNFPINSNNLNSINANVDNPNTKWKGIFSDIEKEEKIIGDKLDSFKRRNQELTKELEVTKKKFIEMKVENLGLKERLQKNGSNYQSNFNSENDKSKETSSKMKSSSVDTKQLKEKESLIREANTVNNLISKRPSSGSSHLKATPEKSKLYSQPLNNNMQKSNDNTYNEINLIKNQLLSNGTKPRIASAERKEKVLEKAQPEQYKSSGNNFSSLISKPTENQRLHTIEEKTLADSVLNFLGQMTQLQENIAKKSPTVSDLKKDFELKKRELIKFAEKINTSLKTEADYKTPQDIYNFGSNTNFNSNTSRTGKAIVSIPRNKSMHSHNNSSVMEKEEHLSVANSSQDINKTIASLKEEIRSMNETTQQDKIKYLELEKKIKEEKMMSNLIKEKLHQEKEKNRNFEIKIEELEEKMYENRSSFNLDSKFSDLKVKNTEFLELVKKNEEELYELNLKLSNALNENKNISIKIGNLLTELKIKDEKIFDCTLEKELLESIKNKSENEIILIEKNTNEIKVQLVQEKIEKENLSKSLELNQIENSNLKSQNDQKTEDNTKLKEQISELNLINEELNKNMKNEKFLQSNESEKLKKLISQLEEEKVEFEKNIKTLEEKFNVKENESKNQLKEMNDENTKMVEINKNLSENLHKSENEARKLSEILHKDKNSLSIQIEGIMKENENLQEIMTYVEKEKDQIQEELDGLKDKLSLLHNEKKELILENEKLQKNFDNEIKSQEEQKEKLKYEYEERLVLVEKNQKIEIDSLQSQINSKISENSKLSSEKEKTCEEKNLILKGIENLNFMIESMNKEKINLLNQINKLQEEKENLQNNYNLNKYTNYQTLSQIQDGDKFESQKENPKLKKEIEKLKNDIAEFNNMNDFLKKELSETNRLLNEQIMSHKQDLNNSYMTNKEKNKEKLGVMEFETEKLQKKLEESNEKLNQQIFLLEEIKEEKINLENNLAEKDEKINKLNTDYQIALKESKEMKNKLAQFKMEFSSINDEKENELEKIRENNDYMSTNEIKYSEYLKKLLLKLNAWEGSKLIVKKKYNMEEENYDVYILIDEVSTEVDKLHGKIVDLQKLNESGNRLVGTKLNELNVDTEKKLNEYFEENKKLKFMNEEYNKKIIDTVKENAPHLIDNYYTSNEGDLSTMELFRLYNEELNKINSLFEEKYTKALNQAKKYKELYLNAENKLSANITPETHNIIADKAIGDLKWILIAEKAIENEKISFDNTQWIKTTSNTVLKYNLTDFNQYKTENEKNKEITDLLSIQSELILKLGKKQDEISKLKIKLKASLNNINSATASVSVAANQPSIQVNNIGDIMNNSSSSNKIPDCDDTSSKKGADCYISNKDFYTNVDTIPLDQYHKLLESMVEEQEKHRQCKLILEKLSVEYETMRNILEHNKSRIERQGFSEIKDIKEGDASRFLDEDMNMNEMFMNNEIRISEGTRRSIVKTDRISEMGEKDTPQNPTLSRRNSKESIKTYRRLDSQTSAVKDSFRDNVIKLEENEKLLADQLTKIKEELKDTRNQRDVYKRKYEESITLQNGKKNEIVSMLKQAFERLVAEITISNKSKEYITVILKILDYNETEINRIIKKEKKSFFGIFNNGSNTK